MKLGTFQYHWRKIVYYSIKATTNVEYYFILN